LTAMQVIADNLQITRPEIEAALFDGDPEPIRSLARNLEAAGADGIDINSGPLPRNPESGMALLVEAVQSATNCRLLLDTTNPRAIAAGLRQSNRPVIINGISMEPAKLEHILPLAAAFDADVIAYLLDAKSRVPSTEAECYEIAVALLQAGESAGLDKSRLIIDPVVSPLMWENGCARNQTILSVIGNLAEVLGFPVRTIAGISNLTSGRGPASKKRLFEAAYLPMLAAAGLDMALLNVFHDQTVRVARACTTLTEQALFSWAAVD